MSETLSAAPAGAVAPAVAAAPGVPHAPGPASVAGAFGSLVVVLLLIVALGWAARRLQQWRGARGGLLQVLGGASLGGKERVVVLRAGEAHFLIGVAPGGVSLLHRFDAAPDVAPDVAPDAGAAMPAEGAFATRLRELLGPRSAP
ncbi:flagellar biosynthetic protein FliO [Solimonas flava]|uniref:flagellar biosynthetic protein FliO n=1 Tax=Solimonas flava TaxID=415849 RepID=UPI0004084CFC|nr:flagellar biosynthetic protein FliO [Solimonas flava]